MLSLEKIKKNVNSSLHKIINSTVCNYNLDAVSPALYDCIKEYAFRDGKRIRSVLFVIGYMGFADRAAPNFYLSASSLELFHTFILIHDDIIDHSKSRRGKPSLHVKFDSLLKNFGNGRVKGEDLSLVVGDILYSMAIHSFLSVQENHLRKENALRKILETAFYTGNGQLVELINGMKKIGDVSLRTIYRTYDLKTAAYSFAGPLTAGAILAGAKGTVIKSLFDAGIKLGRAFQIKDDLMDLFSETSISGKDLFRDITEAKKTLLIWHAYRNGTKAERNFWNEIFSSGSLSTKNADRVRSILSERGSVEYALRVIQRLFLEAELENASSSMKVEYGNLLRSFSESLLDFRVPEVFTYR